MTFEGAASRIKVTHPLLILVATIGKYKYYPMHTCRSGDNCGLFDSACVSHRNVLTVTRFEPNVSA